MGFFPDPFCNTSFTVLFYSFLNIDLEITDLRLCFYSRYFASIKRVRNIKHISNTTIIMKIIKGKDINKTTQAEQLDKNKLN